MDARLSQDGRRAVPERIFAALCAHYPERYVALVDPKVAANSPERVLTASSATPPAHGSHDGSA
jgi:hypothetical protein